MEITMSQLINSDNRQMSLDFSESDKQNDTDKSEVVNLNHYAESRKSQVHSQAVQERLLMEAKKLRW